MPVLRAQTLILPRLPSALIVTVLLLDSVFSRSAANADCPEQEIDFLSLPLSALPSHWSFSCSEQNLLHLR